MELTHFNQSGKARMVDVTLKSDTVRRALACGRVRMLPQTLELIKKGQLGKGDVLAVAQVAGIMGAKRTSEIIPMCHPLMLTGINLNFAFNDKESCIDMEAVVTTTGKTGVEMEALTAVTVAGLTIYDMCKAVDRGMILEKVCLKEKSGGKSGHYTAEGV